MEKTDDYISNRLEWKAGKYNLPSSFYFRNLSLDIQGYLNNHIDKENSGLPVLFFTKPTKEWTLVCTRQVICSNNQTVFSVNIADIGQFKPTAFDNFVKGQAIELKEIKKAEWSEVTIIDKSGNSYILHADKGSDLFALWSILLMAAALHS